MKTPSNITYGSTVYTVREIENLLDDAGSTKLDGHIVYGKSEIRVDAGLDFQRKRIVIFHELIHAIMDQAGLDLEDKNEAICDVIAHGMISALRSNPYLRCQDD
jgi:hypothetical protein